MGIGLIAGMLPGGLLLIPRSGKSAVAQIGCTILVLAFGLLAATSPSAQFAVDFLNPTFRCHGAPTLRCGVMDS